MWRRSIDMRGRPCPELNLSWFRLTWLRVRRAPLQRRQCGIIAPSNSGQQIMRVTEKDVAYVAGLANLELTQEEQAGMVRDLNSILHYVERLNELDTSNVAPMAQVSHRYGVDGSKPGTVRFSYASREDIPEGLRKSLPRAEALANAPDSDGMFFKVPRVIER